MQWGDGVENPREFLDELEEYNERVAEDTPEQREKDRRSRRRRNVFAARNPREFVWRQESSEPKEEKKKEEKELLVYDVKGFFPNVERVAMLEAVMNAMKETWEKMPRARYF